MELRFWAATDTGRVRDHNEDNFLVDQDLQLFVVCDGMGGHAAGEVASAVCVRTVRDVIAGQGDLLAHIRQEPDDEIASEKLKQLLRTAIQSACNRIFEMAQQDPNRRGMGTTCVALVLAGKRGFVGHVGDSRMYRIRDESVEQVTDDHSLLNEMIRQGKVAPGTTEEEFPHKNAVTRAVGVRESVDVDAFTIAIHDGDRLLMCSDGLNEYFDDTVDLYGMMGTAEPEDTTKQCINFANQAGGKDNITVVVVDCETEADDTQPADPAPERAEVIEMLRQTAYFHYLAPPELEQIRKMASRITLEADEAVVSDGEDNDKLFLILKGSVSLQLDGEQVSVLTTGEHFGEMALIDAQDEQDTNMVAQTLEPSIFLAIERDQFVGLLRNTPGLAIKLLWNFVQVFADRLQTVPPEYRFTPDEWRGDPEAIADVTPPAGTLVFEEDLERAQEDSDANEEVDEGDVDDVPPLPPSYDSDPQLEVSAQAAETTDGDVDEESEQPTDAADPPEVPPDLRQTVGLDDVDLDRLQAARADATGRNDEEEKKSGEAADDELSSVSTDRGSTSAEEPMEDDRPPSVEFNRPDLSEPSSRPEGDEQGLTSGTYDQSVLEAGVSGEEGRKNQQADAGAGRKPETDGNEEEEGPPSVSFNRKSAPQSSDPEISVPVEDDGEGADSSPEKEGYQFGDEASKDDLRATMQLDWEADTEEGRTMDSVHTNSDAESGTNSAASSEDDDETTVEWEPGTELSGEAGDGPGAESRSNDRADRGPKPSAEVLKKAKGKLQESVSDNEAGPPPGAESGEPAAQSEQDRSDESEQDENSDAEVEQKVMISPELMAESNEEE